jgi:predicted permease
MNLRDWRLRMRALFAPRRVERELDDELSFHLERETQKLIAGGMTGAEARARARARFGPVPLAADECRDARGTVFVDDTVRDVLYAMRTFRRTPLVAVTIVATMALGLGLVTVAFTILNGLLFRTDAVPDVHEMFAVARPSTAGSERQPFTRRQLDALRRETSVFTGAYGEQSQVDSRVDGRLMFGTFVTGDMFQVLGVRAAIGRALTPADDEPSAAQPVMVLSDRGWDRLFARDRAVVGRRLIVNQVPFEIVGVMPEGFRGLAVAPDDYWAPLSTLGQVRPGRTGAGVGPPSRGSGGPGVDIVGRLRPGMSREAAVAQLAVWDAHQSDRRERGGASITLVPRRGTVQQSLEAVSVTGPLFFAFGLILLIGCANVANLLLARGVARQREIGIQLSLGATRRRLVRQLMTESLLLALAGAAGGILVSRVVLEVVITSVVSTMPPDIGDVRLMIFGADWRVLLFVVLAAAVSTTAFALAPALRATGIDPVRTMRGEAAGSVRPGRARSLLVGVQVSASALLLICAAVFLRSAFAAATFDSGMRTADTLIVQIPNEANRGAIVQALTAEPSVAAVGASWPDMPPDAHAESSGVKAAVAYKFASPEYFSVLDIAVVRGRAFTAAERAPSIPVAIVSETAARTLWPNRDPVGQSVRLDPDPSPGGPDDGPTLESRTLTVVGVVRDVAGLRFARFKQAVVYVPVSSTTERTSLVARVRGDAELSRQALLNRLTAIDPDTARQVITMRTLASLDTYFLRIGFGLTIVLGGLALSLTVSGLFSVLSYLVEQRTKEIGVRMALGATTRNVMGLILSQSIRPVGIGLVVGGGAAAAFSAVLLATSGAAGIRDVVHVLDPMAYVTSVLVIVAACLAAASIPATRAAHLDPMRALRED